VTARRSNSAPPVARTLARPAPAARAGVHARAAALLVLVLAAAALLASFRRSPASAVEMAAPSVTAAAAAVRPVVKVLRGRVLLEGESSAASLVGQSKQKTSWKPTNQRTTH
jgi:hypothetical protein